MKINRTSKIYGRTVTMETESRDRYGLTSTRIHAEPSSYVPGGSIHLDLQDMGEETVSLFVYRPAFQGRPSKGVSVTVPLAMLQDALRDLRTVDAPLPTLEERDDDTEPCDMDWYASEVMVAAYAPNGLPY